MCQRNSRELNSSQNAQSILTHPPKYIVDSFTRPQTQTYAVTVTQPDNSKIGTVNNCSCNFFTRHHSACKHMFVVARQTRFRISEKVEQPSHSPKAASSPNEPNRANFNLSEPQASSLPPDSYQPVNAVEEAVHHSTPQQSNPNLPEPQPSIAPKESTSARATTDSPHFSVRSYLEMCRGQTRQHSQQDINWGHHLHTSGILQSQNHPHPSHTAGYDRPH